jgi:cytochrome c553
MSARSVSDGFMSDGLMRVGVVRLGVIAGTLVLLTACASRPDPFMGSPERGQMLTHFNLALDLRGFAIHGDLDAFRETAQELADLEPAKDLPAEMILQFGDMRWQTSEGALAETTEDAAHAAARVAATCGECHDANMVGLGERFTLGGPPPAGSPARHMAGLAWASRLLWDGLVGPSDRTWFTGAEGLIELGALPEGLPTAYSENDVAIAGARLRQLGERATLQRDVAGRTDVLGDIWTTCAGCHTGGM